MSEGTGKGGRGVDVESLREAITIMARLRGPGGCPWDQEQTFDSIKRHTLEETYEVFDAIERRAWPELKDELGDLLLQVLFYSQMAAEAGYFTIEDVSANLSAKLIRRHPHIFGEAKAESSDDVKVHWERIKLEERLAAGKAAAGLLDEVPRTMPALIEAEKLGRKAAKVGFDWPDADGLFEKVTEEIAEVKAEVAGGEMEGLREEVGDLLFTVVNLARKLGVDAEFALRDANGKFRRRFGAMEMAASGSAGLEERSAEELEELWRVAKAAEKH